jgi:hypothetical protein
MSSLPIQNVIKGEVQIRYRKIKTAGAVTIGEKAALRDTFLFGKQHQRVGRFHVLLVLVELSAKKIGQLGMIFDLEAIQ